MADNRIRAGDADRERVVARLGRHHAEGRLDLEEFERRVDAAYAATYVDELPRLVADLPPEGASDEPRHDAPRSWSPACRRPRSALLPVVVLVAVALSIGALAHGHPPFGLLWLFLLLWWKPWRGHRRHGHERVRTRRAADSRA